MKQLFYFIIVCIFLTSCEPINKNSVHMGDEDFITVRAIENVEPIDTIDVEDLRFFVLPMESNQIVGYKYIDSTVTERMDRIEVEYDSIPIRKKYIHMTLQSSTLYDGVQSSGSLYEYEISRLYKVNLNTLVDNDTGKDLYTTAEIVSDSIRNTDSSDNTVFGMIKVLGKLGIENVLVRRDLIEQPIKGQIVLYSKLERSISPKLDCNCTSAPKVVLPIELNIDKRWSYKTTPEEFNYLWQ
ncbi:MAG: hypothetical protein MRY57_03330 [Candidatus Pacebacteria bacterium]|nr:hypothetical protein [Candidatus Paceibacterota bacterium]